MKQKKKAKGVTLIEVIMSVALIAILIVPLSNVVLAAFQTNKNGEIKQKASFVGQKVLEEMEAYDELKLEDDGTNKYFELLDGDITKAEDNITKDTAVANKYNGSISRNYLGKKFTVDVIMERDTNFNYDSSSQNTDNVYDLSYKLSETGSGVRIQKMISQGAEDPKSFDLNNLTLKIDGTSTVGTSKVNIFEKGKSTDVLFEHTATGDLDKGISIQLDKTFSSNLNVEVDAAITGTTFIYIIKDKDCTGNVNVTSTAGNIKVNRYMNINEGESIADLYNINVKVEGTLYKGKEIVTEVLFEGSTKKNIKFK
ncbi:type IV pilus modification PilV family protein [Clostridium vincentii]|uniref:Uncharacterized protein n=1 Tax=Clostridium vincentii TaxID=52704 RepID=A0A2T0BC31_9CLOT|nr:prepilin-type N-terminal cleavage/methylation domain-containing protein [Clostridium vincentii]PRR81456.1 hypothetical protein CLVI_24830 [Clostridium vincentii]